MPLIPSVSIITIMTISPEITSLIEEIKNDRTHGASQLARQAIAVIKVAAKNSQANNANQFLMEQKEVGQQLIEARPAMATIYNIVNNLLNTIAKEAANNMELDKLRLYTAGKANEAIKSSLKAIEQITQHAARLISGGDRIMTHSYSSTVTATLKETFSKYGNISVITTRSGPGGSGAITARELAGYGIPVTFIDDTAVGLYIPKVNKVIIGADRICADGKIINGVGSYQLAIAAEKTRVPLYVLSDSLKFDPRLKGEEVDLEEKEPSEVIEPGRLPPGVKVKNPYFDVTPLELVTGIVTEAGLHSQEQVLGYIKGLH